MPKKIKKNSALKPRKKPRHKNFRAGTQKIESFLLQSMQRVPAVSFSSASFGKFDFDPDIKGFNKKNSYLLAKAAKLAYADEDEVITQVRRWGFLEDPIVLDWDLTQGFIAHHRDYVLVSFRGTNSFFDWLRNFKFVQKKETWGRVHSGFKQAANAVWTIVQSKLEEWAGGKKGVWLTGHSLGAAIATITAARLLNMPSKTFNLGGVHTFGSPRVVDSKFANEFNTRFGDQSFRFVNNEDFVPCIPLKISYHHVDTGYLFDEDGRLRKLNKGTAFAPLKQFLNQTPKQIEAKAWMQLEQDNPYQTRYVQQGLFDIFSGIYDHNIDCYIDLLEP